MFVIRKNMPSAPHSIHVEKDVIKLFDLVETDLCMEEYIRNANEIISRSPEYRCKVHDSLLKMRTYYLSSK